MGTTLTRLVVLSSIVAVAVIAAFALMPGDGARRAGACGTAGPFYFDTYEAPDSLATYSEAIELAVAGKAITFAYTVNGENVDVRYQGLLSGPRGSRTSTGDTSLRIPPTLYKAVAVIEVGFPWANARGEVPWGGVGRANVGRYDDPSRVDCGYGLGQITSGMFNNTGTAAARQAVIGTHFMFNLAEGIRILADKWNSAPRFRPIAGEGDPAVLEDWYYGIWSYNGFAFLNHPLNPRFDPLRPDTHYCRDREAAGYGSVNFSHPYQELVYGCVVTPPRIDGQPAWDPIAVNMPDLRRPAVAAAFDVKNFVDIDADTGCEDRGFSGGCPEMDFPTTFEEEEIPDPACEAESDACPPIVLPAEVPHHDLTPAVNPALAAKYLGSPQLTFSGPGSLDWTVNTSLPPPVATISIGNDGTYVAPFRVRTTASWLMVRRPADPASMRFHGGVAVGDDVDVVLQSRPTEITQPGYTRELTITVLPNALPSGTSTASVWIEPLLGGGGPFEIELTATRYDPVPTEPEDTHYAIAPSIARSN